MKLKIQLLRRVRSAWNAFLRPPSATLVEALRTAAELRRTTPTRSAPWAEPPCGLCADHVGWSCLNCGKHTHISHQSTFCKVDGRSDVFVHWCCPDACHYSTVEGLAWRNAERQRNWPDDDRLCHCHVVNNPPCSSCEHGLTDPDAEVPF